MTRREHAAGSRNDVPAPVSAIHAAARRSGRVRRDGVAGQGLLANQMASPDVVFNQAIDAALSAEPSAPASRRRRPQSTSGISRSRWRSTRRASPTRATSRSCSSAASRPRRSSRSSRPTSPACRRRTPRDVARPRHHAAGRHRREDHREGHRAEEPGGDRVVRPVRVRRCAPAGAADDDAAAAVAAVRHDPAGARRHLQHHGDAATRRSFRGREYRIRIEWTCDPARTATLVQRVFEEIAFVQDTRSRPSQVALIRAVAAAGLRAEQPGQRLSPQPDRAPVRGRRGGEPCGRSRMCRPRSPR